MIKKILKVNFKNKQKYDVKFRDYVLFLKIILMFILIWLVSSLYYQFLVQDTVKILQGENLLTNNKNFYYLVYVHAVLFSNLIFVSVKKYSKQDYFWKITKKQKYLSYLIWFIPSYIANLVFLAILSTLNLQNAFICFIIVILANICALNFKMMIKNKIAYIVVTMIFYLVLCLVVKIPNIFWINITNIIWLTVVILSVVLFINNFYKNTQEINFNVNFKKDYKSELDIYFLNIFRAEKVLPISIFIIVSIVINSYYLKHIETWSFISTIYDYLIQVVLLYFISNIAFSLEINFKFKKFFYKKILVKKFITFNVFALIFFMIALIVNNISLSLFIKNIKDSLYLYQSLLVIVSIMLGSQIGTLIYKEKTKLTSILVFVISLLPSAISMYINDNKTLYVVFGILYWILANMIIVLKEKYEKYI